MNSNTNILCNAYNPNTLPYITANARHSQASYDRTGGNQDYNNHLYIDEHNERVIFDAFGPGCIYKLFLPTTGTDQAWLKFYFDDEDMPRIHGTIKELFGLDSIYFNQAFVDINVPPESGIVSYSPISFSKRLKITASFPNVHAHGYDLFYHHFDYTIYPPDQAIPSWSQDLDFNFIAQQFSNTGKPITLSGGTQSFTFDLGSQEAIDLCQLQRDHSQISSFTLSLDDFDADDDNFKILKDLMMTITFDNVDQPQIQASLANIFAFPDYGIDPNSSMIKEDKYNKTQKDGATYRTHGICTGIDTNGTFYFKLPMPFYKSASIRIENISEKNFSGTLSLSIEDFDTHIPFGYLHITQKTFEIQADENYDINYMDVQGSGNFVGIVATMDSDRSVDTSSYLEGDEHIYINNSRTPQINGTGTEDFYNGAYYWYNGTYSTPTYGCSYNAKWMRGRIHCPILENGTYMSGAYRFMIGDSIPFQSSLKFDMEHGFINDCYEKGLVALFYYLNPNIYYTATDHLQLANTNATTNHHYRSTLSDKLLCTSTFEGLSSNHSQPTETLVGEVICHNGSAQFEMSTNENSKYVRLKRTFEYTFSNQQASVYIDGCYAGEWYDPGCNTYMRFRESEFTIPPHLTKDKKTLSIQLAVKSSVWSAFDYQINCISY